MLESVHARNHISVLADVVRCVGILSKENFDPSIGVDHVYKRGLLKSIPKLLGLGAASKDPASRDLFSFIVRQCSHG
jgi:hypothetical protein